MQLTCLSVERVQDGSVALSLFGVALASLGTAELLRRSLDRLRQAVAAHCDEIERIIGEA